MVVKGIGKNLRLLVGPPKTSWRIVAVVLAVVLPLVLSSCRGSAKEAAAKEKAGAVSKVVQATKQAEVADPLMGDWQGSWVLSDGDQSGGLVAQVIALGKGMYRVSLFEEFDRKATAISVLEDELRDGKVRFAGPARYQDFALKVEMTLEPCKFTGKFEGKGADGEDVSGTFKMEKTVRLSPALGAKPPAGAVVLFDGKKFDQWERISSEAGKKEVRWKLLRDGAMEIAPGGGSIVTKKKFKDFELHLEFRTPFMPDAHGQGRGNSGVYLQGRYEIQILDSYGLEGRDNECGGIYTVAAPLVNMCAPPMQWQTYDITFRSPRFDNAGGKLIDALLTVVHNGVKIHDKIKIPGPTGGALDGNIAQPGGIYLQDHGNTVQFRNIWLVELPPESVSQ
jgi:hypothetical protein